MLNGENEEKELIKMLNRIIFKKVDRAIGKKLKEYFGTANESYTNKEQHLLNGEMLEEINLSLSILELNLEPKVLNILLYESYKRFGSNYHMNVGELLNFTKNDLLKLPNFGTNSLSKLIFSLQDLTKKQIGETL